MPAHAGTVTACVRLQERRSSHPGLNHPRSFSSIKRHGYSPQERSVSADSSHSEGFVSLSLMPPPVADRIKKLRDEIAQITKTGVQSLQQGRSGEGGHRWQDVVQEAERQRRVQRLQEILKELDSLTAWKRV